VFECYFELYPHLHRELNYAFLDEIQNVKDWELGVRRIYDTRSFRLFLTGSSSKFLSREIATSLRGRALNFEVLPFSFKEFIKAKGIDAGKDRNLIYSSKRFSVKRYLEEYFETGSFPEVALEKNENIKTRILKEYLSTMFFRDMIERYNIRNEAVIREMVRFFSSNVSSIFSLNNIWKWLRQSHPLTKKTLLNYSACLEDTGLFFYLRKFSFSVKEQAQTRRKVYIVDNGLRNASGFRFSEDKGKILENTVFLELKQRQNRDPSLELFYFQDYEKREVDFVLKEKNRIKCLMQVCASLQNFETKKREINSLLSAGRDLRCGNLIVLTLEEEGEEKIQGKKMVFKPAWKWLLE
jgi:predicted AAA+ superfamily ATPase